MNKQNINNINYEEININQIFNAIWSKRNIIFKTTGISTFIGIIYLFFSTPLYLSTITMYPSSTDGISSAMSQYAGVAASFGVDVGISEAIYHIPDIVNSKRIKTEIIEKKWISQDYKQPVDLIKYWKINEIGFSLNPITYLKKIISSYNSETVDQRYEHIEIALEEINDRISVREDKSGLVIVNVLMEEPRLSASIANFIYDAIVDYTINVHNAQAKLNREFIEKRQAEVKEELNIVEEKLKYFRERNRSIKQSPQLQMELEQHLRDVKIQTEIYITLQQQYELARIEEVKETPSVVILDQGRIAYEKTKPKTLVILIFYFLAGVFLSLTGILIKKFHLNL